MSDLLADRVRRLGLYGVLRALDELRDAPWLAQLLELEEIERKARSLERRIKNAKLGSYAPMVDFDLSWPQGLDPLVIDELFTLAFLEAGENVILVGPNGLGKTMIAQNLAHHAILAGHSARFTTAADMLNDLASQESAAALARRLRRYVNPQLLVVDEVGYFNYDNRYADLLFEVVSKRYAAHKSIVLTTNLRFQEWPDHFQNAACVVTLIDRLAHRAEILQLSGKSYRHKEAAELQAQKRERRATQAR